MVNPPSPFVQEDSLTVCVLGEQMKGRERSYPRKGRGDFELTEDGFLWQVLGFEMEFPASGMPHVSQSLSSDSEGRASD